MALRVFVFALLFGCTGLTVSPARASGYSSLNAGIAAENESRYGDALTFLSSAIAAPDLPPALLPVAYLDRATALMSAKRFVDAVKDCDAALHLKPDWYEAYEICGAAHVDSGDSAGAVTQLSDAVALKPSVPNGYILRAFSYESEDRFNDAVADDSRVIALEPDEAEGYVDRATAYDLQGHFDLALADWTKAADINSDDYRIPRAIGVDQWALGQYRDAGSAFARARRLAPDSLYSQIWLDIVAIARDSSAKPDRLSLSDGQLSAWPGPILKYFAGNAQPADVMAAAASDPQNGAGQTCEANFYVGEWQRLHNAADGGKAYLDEAVKACPHGFIEYMAAGVELRRMKQGP